MKTGDPRHVIPSSSPSRELERALAVAMAAPDVRADKVARARERIGQGTYTVMAEVIAMAILGFPG
jgi:anti-sigma28 factor (negative regulator of flagellin synthesis)